MITIEPYSTHLPLLCAAIASTKGAVIELGAGLYSTPVLQGICIAQGRPLRTFENDKEWMYRFLAIDGQTSGQLFTSIDSWDDVARYGEELACSVAFIDVAPAAARGELINVMRRWADIIIVHDVETEQRHNYPGVEEALQQFKYRVEDRRRGPWTAAVSNRDINFLRKAVL